MTSRPRTKAILGWLLTLILAGCVPAVATPTSGLSPTADPDFTQPGAAAAMVDSLLAEAGSRQALLVEIAETSVQVSVLTAEGKPVTWANRDGKSAEVPSDLAYVDQATFDISAFNISDVGGLFRAAASMSGSEEKQGLTIVDYSGGEVMMSVSTFPESQTVFFNPDGSLLSVLNFDAPGGIADGIQEVLGERVTVYSVSVQSDRGAWAEFPGAEEGTTVRRTRTSKVPVTTIVRNETVDLPLFAASRVRPDVIWRVLDGVRGTSEAPEDARWEVVIDFREDASSPEMHFTIGSKSLVTDLNGTVTG